MLRYANILSDRFLNSIFSNFRSLFSIYYWRLLWDRLGLLLNYW